MPLRRFRPAGLVGDGPEPPLRIVFPPNGAQLELAAGEHGPVPLAVKISGGAAPLTFLVNGIPIAGEGARRTVFFTPDGPGFFRLTATDAKGAADSVVVLLQ
jgi:penicillin-binding protein 1C